MADQHGSPTSALDIADGIMKICRNLLTQPHDKSLRGVFHMTGAGDDHVGRVRRCRFRIRPAMGGQARACAPSRRPSIQRPHDARRTRV